MVCELGGKNATVVDADADIDLAAQEIVKGAFGFQGQSVLQAHEPLRLNLFMMSS